MAASLRRIFVLTTLRLSFRTMFVQLQEQLPNNRTRRKSNLDSPNDDDDDENTHSPFLAVVYQKLDTTKPKQTISTFLALLAMLVSYTRTETRLQRQKPLDLFGYFVWFYIFFFGGTRSTSYTAATFNFKRT